MNTGTFRYMNIGTLKVFENSYTPEYRYLSRI